MSNEHSRVAAPEGRRRAVQAINNEHSRVAAPEGRRRAVQAIKRLIRKMRLSLDTKVIQPCSIFV